jgi:thioesterase domain-containing protein
MSRYQDYSGAVILLRARQGLLGARDDPTLGWSTWLKRPVEVQQVPGDHESILFGPRIPGVAAILNGYLERATRN